VNAPFPTPIRKFFASVAKGDNPGVAAWKAARELGEFVPVVGGTLKYGSAPGGAIGEMVTGAGSIIAEKKGPLPSGWEIGGKLIGVPGGGQMKKSLRQMENPEADMYDVIMGTYPGDRETMIREILEKYD